jgi:hypothetical protein
MKTIEYEFVVVLPSKVAWVPGGGAEFDLSPFSILI